ADADGARLAIRRYEYARIAFLVGPIGGTKKTGALIGKIVFAAIEGGYPFPALEQQDVQSGGGQFLGDNATTRTRAHDDRVVLVHGRSTFAFGSAGEFATRSFGKR